MWCHLFNSAKGWQDFNKNQKQKSKYMPWIFICLFYFLFFVTSKFLLVLNFDCGLLFIKCQNLENNPELESIVKYTRDTIMCLQCMKKKKVHLYLFADLFY